MLDFQKELLYLWILTLNYTIMKKFYYVILSMIAIALVSCTSELDEINNGRHSASTGYINSTYATSTFKWPSQGISVTLTGIVKMTCNSQSGDSGCIVYTPDDMNIAGTLIGGVTNSNPSYFMPASRTVEKYGLELY